MTFAMREYTTTQREDLYELVSRRQRRGSLIVTTNREPDDLYARSSNKAPLLIDRYRPLLPAGGSTPYTSAGSKTRSCVISQTAASGESVL